MKQIVTIVALFALLAVTSVEAQTEPKQADSDLAKQLSNPVADLVSVPFQANWNFGVGPGPDDDTQFLMNFQPVMPFALNKNWNLIARVIVPYLGQPPLTTGGSGASGFSDILASGFFSPSQPKHFIWGIGPALQLPVPTEPTLGTGKWSIGPTFVILKQTGHWTYGVLVNQLWSFAGDDSRPSVNQMYVQPFGAYTTDKATTYQLSSETTATWNQPSSNTWTVPLIAQVTQLLRLGRRPVSVGAGAGYYVESPDGGPNWKFRVLVTLIFPK
jgi:hypothetical protein